MQSTAPYLTILMADDDEEDCMLALDALEETCLANSLTTVSDGEELLDYLKQRGRFSNPASAPRPQLILLDLNMPKKDGREALQDIKADPNLRQIPVVVMTTSSADEDVIRSYDLGANSYITKPVTFDGLVEVMKRLDAYWSIVTLPRKVA
ncbi:MAG: response regulator [Synechococcus sp.]